MQTYLDTPGLKWRAVCNKPGRGGKGSDFPWHLALGAVMVQVRDLRKSKKPRGCGAPTSKAGEPGSRCNCSHRRSYVRRLVTLWGWSSGEDVAENRHAVWWASDPLRSGLEFTPQGRESGVQFVRRQRAASVTGREKEPPWFRHTHLSRGGTAAWTAPCPSYLPSTPGLSLSFETPHGLWDSTTGCVPELIFGETLLILWSSSHVHPVHPRCQLLPPRGLPRAVIPWFQDRQHIPESKDVQIPYKNGTAQSIHILNSH